MLKRIQFVFSTLLTQGMERMAQSAGKAKKNWLDKIITKGVAMMLNTRKNQVDFMEDELVDSEPGFDVEELKAYEKGS